MGNIYNRIFVLCLAKRNYLQSSAFFLKKQLLECTIQLRNKSFVVVCAAAGWLGLLCFADIGCEKSFVFVISFPLAWSCCRRRTAKWESFSPDALVRALLTSSLGC
jgi:hypothetical protein